MLCWGMGVKEGDRVTVELRGESVRATYRGCERDSIHKQYLVECRGLTYKVPISAIEEISHGKNSPEERHKQGTPPIELASDLLHCAKSKVPHDITNTFFGDLNCPSCSLTRNVTDKSGSDLLRCPECDERFQTWKWASCTSNSEYNFTNSRLPDAVVVALNS